MIGTEPSMVTIPLGKIGLNGENDLGHSSLNLSRTLILVSGEVFIAKLRLDHVEVPLLQAIQEVVIAQLKGASQS